jgi:hypothetical protein
MWILAGQAFQVSNLVQDGSELVLNQWPLHASIFGKPMLRLIWTTPLRCGVYLLVSI